MINPQGIIDFCNNHNYDLRQSHNGRWIDQKCTPDVIWSIADFVLYYVENLIALTPNQHFNFAHPDNNTQIIDVAAQKVLLIAKTHSIQKNLTDEAEEEIYEFAKLLFVLATGWNDDSILDIEENDYTDVLHTISYHYDMA